MSDGKDSRLNSLQIRGIGFPKVFRLTKYQHFLLLLSSYVRDEMFNLKKHVRSSVDFSRPWRPQIATACLPLVNCAVIFLGTYIKDEKR